LTTIRFPLEHLADPNLTFFRDVLQFTEHEIETATQSAIEYFNATLTWFGFF